MKLKTIYEYLNDFTKEEIDKVIDSLDSSDKILLYERYGNDLNNPKTSENWNKTKTEKFYGSLIPKMKRLLIKNRKNTIVNKDEIGNIEIKEDKNMEVIDNNDIIIEDVKDDTLELVDLIKKGSTCNDICKKLNCSNTELYNELLTLKNKGILVSRKYYSNGEIRYKNIHTIQELKHASSYNFCKNIITDKNENQLKVLLISDLHFGNEAERLDLIDRAYNYCAKNGINIILCGGDFIDGTYTQGTQKISDVYDQIDYLIKNYPYDKNILTFGVGGDHDISALHTSSIDINNILNNMRHDIIIGGFNNTLLNIKNDNIQLYHHIEKGKCFNFKSPIILHGHSHKFAVNKQNDILNVTIPSLSDIGQTCPTALEMTLEFKNGYIITTLIKQVLLSDKDYVLSELVYDFPGKVNIAGSINNEEDFKQFIKKEEIKQKTLINRNMSQIEKFNARYGK